MADYSDLDESELQRMLKDAGSYEERSLIRQALRQKKKQRGGAVGRSKGGTSVYNRFAGTARSTAPAPKNFVATASEPETPKTESVVSQPSKPTSAPPQQADISPNDEPPIPEPVADTPPTPEPSSAHESPPTPEPSSAHESPEPSPTHESPPTPEPSPTQESPPTPEPSPTPTPEPTSPNESLPKKLDHDVDGCGDPGLGEEGGSVSVSADKDTESVPETEVTAPKSRDRAIEETDAGSQYRKFKAETHTKSGQPTVDFGVKLRKTAPQPKSKPASGGAPRTLRDYQELSSRSKVSRPTVSDEQPMEVDELQKYLVAYVNKELAVSPPLPAKGRALFEVASDPANLCKLINKSVANTVDLRALTKVPVRGSAEAKREALEENMVLVVESARAIGCRVTDSSGDQIMQGDPSTIRQFLVDLIRARVVHMPGMDEEPSSTFSNMATLFSKLDISLDSVDGGDPKQEPPTQEVAPPTQEVVAMTYEERAALRKAEREKKRTSDSPSGNGHEMTYEERAVQRRLEREKRRKEREALAK